MHQYARTHSQQRTAERLRSYAESNPDVAWARIHGEVMAWQGEEQLLVDADEICRLVDAILAEWLSLPRPRPRGLRATVHRYIATVSSHLDRDERAVVWRRHMAALPPQPPIRPQPGAGRPIGRIAAHALVAIAVGGGGNRLTGHAAARYGAHHIAALSDAGLIRRREQSPLVLEVTTRGAQVQAMLSAAGYGPDSGPDPAVWRHQLRLQVAEMVAAA